MLSKVKVHIVIQKDLLFQDYKVKLGGICIQNFILGDKYHYTCWPHPKVQHRG